MAINIFGDPGGIANLVFAKVTAGLGAIGFNAGNVSVVYEIDGANGTMRSWKPGRSINPINQITAGKGYYIIALDDVDMSAYFTPPFTGGTDPGGGEFDESEFG